MINILNLLFINIYLIIIYIGFYLYYINLNK